MFGIRKILLLAALGAAAVLPGAVTAEAFALQEDEPVAMVDETPFADFSLALESWADGTTLKLMQDVSAEPVTVLTEKTLDLNGCTLSLGDGQTGSVLTVSSAGALTVTDSGNGGKITGGNAEKGGGVFVDSRGSLLINGGEISGNTARDDGGGIYVTGRLTLGGNAVVKDNVNAAGKPSNIFLTNGNHIHISGFSGTAGVTAADPSQPFTDGEEYAGEFRSDDSEYIVRGGAFVVAPLSSVTAAFEPSGEVFPTTPLSELKDGVTLSGVNVNGAPYEHEIEFTLSGTLNVGESVLTVTATGVLPDEETEPVTAEVTVNAVAPRLLSFEVLAPEYPQTVYFDTPVGDVLFTVRGSYSDGHSRDILSTPAATAEQNNEPYITDFYTVSGKLSEHGNGYATVAVIVGELSQNFRVAVSRYSLDARDFTIKDVTVVKKSGAWGIGYEWFAPDLPEGIEVEATIGGKHFTGSELAAGVYTVELSFYAADAENYEVTGTRTATLTVNREYYYVTDDANEIVASFTSETGIPPAWSFTAEEGENIRNPALEGDWEPLQVSELTLFLPEGESAGEIGVRLLLGEKARGRDELRLFRVLGDGTLEEVSFTRDGNYLQFTGSDFLETQYVVAAYSGFSLYVGLSIGFGVVCALAAAALLGYLIYKGKFRR